MADTAAPTLSPDAIARVRALADARGLPADCAEAPCVRARRCRGRIQADSCGTSLVLPICLLATRFMLRDDAVLAERAADDLDRDVFLALGLIGPEELADADADP